MQEKKKKEKALYDEHGRWVEERNRIKGAVRRAFRLSPQMKEVLRAARQELPPLLKKDGSPGKKPQVRYRCAICKNLFSQKFVQIDHREPVIKLYKKESEMTYDEIVRGIFCDTSNLQVVCSTPLKKNNGKPSCHKIKTDEENYIRRKLAGSGLAITEEGWETLIKHTRAEYKQYLIEQKSKKCKKKTKKSKMAKK